MEFTDLTPEFLSDYPAYQGHEHVRRFILGDDVVAFIAVHNTNLGPSLGGCRFREYPSEAEALHDVLRLSRGMTYKNAMAGLPLGGGKAVIMGNPKTVKNSDIMEEMGRAVDSLGGSYLTAEDSGTGDDDMAAMAKHTKYVTGLPPAMLKELGSGEVGGNPSPLTAIGVYSGLKAAAKFRYGDASLSNLTVAVQGLGAVGFALCEYLHQDGANIIGCDMDPDVIASAQDKFPGAEFVSVDDIYGVEANILSPCAMGAVLNDETIPQIKADIIAGAANNQLALPKHDNLLAERNILYVPDYVINAGGVICVGYEFFEKSDHNPYGFEMSKKAMVQHVENIGEFVTQALDYAKDQGLHPGAAADQLAEEKFMKSPDVRSSASCG